MHPCACFGSASNSLFSSLFLLFTFLFIIWLGGNRLSRWIVSWFRKPVMYLVFHKQICMSNLVSAVNVLIWQKKCSNLIWHAFLCWILCIIFLFNFVFMMNSQFNFVIAIPISTLGFLLFTYLWSFVTKIGVFCCLLLLVTFFLNNLLDQSSSWNTQNVNGLVLNNYMLKFNDCL